MWNANLPDVNFCWPTALPYENDVAMGMDQGLPNHDRSLSPLHAPVKGWLRQPLIVTAAEPNSSFDVERVAVRLASTIRVILEPQHDIDSSQPCCQDPIFGEKGMPTAVSRSYVRAPGIAVGRWDSAEFTYGRHQCQWPDSDRTPTVRRHGPTSPKRSGQPRLGLFGRGQDRR
ncbi:hypothetical protein SZ00_06106 (plasmid) [Rhodococcus sp. AD45]|nr:hypothetical protein SZ00_06106 [Rhodococcus sp. AD45]